MKGKPIAAVIFVAAFAFVLTIPFRSGDEEAVGAGGPSPSVGAETPAEPDSDDDNGDGGEQKISPFPRTGELTTEYPEECLEQATLEDDGLIAYDISGGIRVRPLNGGEGIVIGDGPPFGFSPSGRFIGSGSGTIYESGGAEAATMSEEDVFHWGWSPLADCAVVAGEDGLFVVRPGVNTTELISKPTERFAFSSTGGTLAYVRVGGAGYSIWKANLDSGETEELVRLGDVGDDQVLLAGWAPDGSDLYYWVGTQDELLGTGENLRSATVDSEKALPHVLAHNDFLTACANKTLAVVGKGARTEASSKRLAYISAGEEPDFVTPEDAWDVSPACAPDGAFIASIHSADPEGRAPKNIALLHPDGTLADTLTSGDDFEDASPLWAPGDAGLVFVRVPLDGPPEIWSAQPGGEPLPTGIVLEDVDPSDPDERRDAWGRYLDWSADPPSGLSATSER